VGDDERADACGGKIGQGSRAQTAAADYQRGGVEQFLLSFYADFVEQNMAAVSQELSVVHGRKARERGCAALRAKMGERAFQAASDDFSLRDDVAWCDEIFNLIGV